MSFFPSNSQFQTHTSISRFQAAVLVGAPSYPNAIAWSDENLIAVASGHLVTILNPATLPFGPRGLITVQNGPPFPIGVIDREDLFSDFLLPTIISRDHEPCVRSISWSPVGLAPNAGCLLAVCTTQGLVKLYRPPYCDFCAEWIEVADLSAKLYDYLVSVRFGEVPDRLLVQCDNQENEQDVQSVTTREGKRRRKENKSGKSSTNPYSKIYGEVDTDVDSDFDPMEERSSHQIVPASKAKVKSVKKIPENSTLPHITVDQYSTRSAMLSSLVVAWSPILQSRAKFSSSPQHDSSLSLLAVGGKSGQVSVWRVSVPECYSVDQSRDPTKLMLIQIIQAHKPWITAISWALLDSDSSNPQLLLATASYNGSVKIWLAYYEQLLKSLEPSSNTPFSLLKEVGTIDMVPVSALSVTVPAQCPQTMHLAVGKGSGLFEVWICNISGQKFHKISPCDGHSQIVTGLAWAFDGQILYTCSQDNFVRCWILSGSSLCEVPIPSNTPGLRSSTDLADGFVSCFGVAVSPGNLAIAWVRNTDVDQLNPMYEARTQKAIAEFFWIGGQQIRTLSNNVLDLHTEAIPGSSEKQLVDWESNIIWSLKQYETQDKPLVVWDIATALLAFRRSKPDFSKVTSRQLHLLNIICRRVILSDMKADEINNKLLNVEGLDGAEEEEPTLWINLLLNSERELRERLVGFTFSSFKSQVLASATNSESIHCFPLGLAQMEQWVELNQDHVQDQLRVLAAEFRKHEQRLSSNSIAGEKCSYCSASVPFESPEVAFCSEGHKLARCAVSMVVCPTTPIWFCMCCHRRALKLAPETLFVIPGPQCPFCGILLQRLQPDFLLSASPT
uniref:uncharacterized protein LOC101299663 isoform X2 n=1 Tax=Fragaria vesca subsp. vesca TaxID=101020 RepID=UPI0005CB36A4|nr:PREDICTED: uncharacterized protein LOC101299663 isoform X2 [Fragaria vesca subsp. vesca]